jgi:hypothetical protein
MSQEHPTRPRFGIVELLLLVAMVAGILGVFQTWWLPGLPNADLLLGVFITCVSTASIGAYDQRAVSRQAMLGIAFFGWVYLVFIWQWRFGNVGTFTRSDADNLAYNIRIGFALALLTGLAVHLVTRLSRPRSS